MQGEPSKVPYYEVAPSKEPYYELAPSKEPYYEAAPSKEPYYEVAQGLKCITRRVDSSDKTNGFSTGGGGGVEPLGPG